MVQAETSIWKFCIKIAFFFWLHFVGGGITAVQLESI